jgi:uncharacterized membrane protein YqaE (UPF0057 family)
MVRGRRVAVVLPPVGEGRRSGIEGTLNSLILIGSPNVDVDDDDVVRLLLPSLAIFLGAATLCTAELELDGVESDDEGFMIGIK